MKRFFSIIIMLLSIVFSSNAQWRINHVKDENKIGKQIINHIRYKGDVRIIASKFHDSDFDVRMTKNPNIRVSSN